MKTVGDPRVALSWLEERRYTWEILLTDSSLPHMTGRDLMQSFKRLAPATKCVVCTGSTDGINEEQALAAGADGFLLKPFDVVELRNLIARLAERPEPRLDFLPE